MIYSEFQYLWPPRPDNALPAMMLDLFIEKGYVAQVKKNGTCSVIAVSPDKTLTAMNRHNEPHKAWAPTEASSAAFLATPGKGWYVFVAELLHSKVPGIRDTNYVFDLLVDDGDYLVGKTFAERYERLRAIFATTVEGDFHYIVDDHTQVAKVFYDDFSGLFESLTKPEDEGVVLKHAATGLALCSRQGSNNASQVKCRRPHHNYNF